MHGTLPIGARNLSRQFLKQVHPQRRIADKGPPQSVDRQEQQQARTLCHQSKGVLNLAEDRGQFEQFACVYLPQVERPLKALGTTLKEPGNNKIQPPAEGSLGKDHLSGAAVEWHGRLGKCLARLGRAGQQFRKGMCLSGFDLFCHILPCLTHRVLSGLIRQRKFSARSPSPYRTGMQPVICLQWRRIHLHQRHPSLRGHRRFSSNRPELSPCEVRARRTTSLGPSPAGSLRHAEPAIPGDPGPARSNILQAFESAPD